MHVAYAEAPEELTRGLLKVLGQQVEQLGRTCNLASFETLWDDHLADALFEWARDETDESPEAWQTVAAVLVRRGHKRTAELVERPGRRLVRSATDLQAVVVEALERIESRLRAAGTPVRAIWDRWGPDAFRPVSEEEVSDRIAEWLKYELGRMGIVAWREVQVRRRPSPNAEKGQRTDILISSPVDRKGREQIQLVVEVKASWSRDLETGMQSQLAERYMKSLSLDQGLYVVAWFEVPDWDPEDPRFAAMRRRGWTLEQARDRLMSQAESLSGPRCSIGAIVMDCGLR